MGVFGAAIWASQLVPRLNFGHHNDIVHPSIRFAPISKALIKRNAESPYVRSLVEPHRHHAFGRRPPDRECACFASVVLLLAAAAVAVLVVIIASGVARAALRHTA